MKKKILILVKAYPALSEKYGELVCTAGVDESGKWYRIYPIPYRKLDYVNRFKKYDWIEVELIKNTSDFRPESYKPKNFRFDDLIPVNTIKSDGDAWIQRRKYALTNIYDNLEILINESKDRNICTSLATFKPKEILKFYWKKTDRTWDERKLKILQSKELQLSVFNSETKDDISEFEVVDKLPYNFYYKFIDNRDKESNLMIEDWETGMLFWNSLKRHEGNEQKACEDVKKKYYDEFVLNKDLHFFLGTRYIEHSKNYTNPFSIIGTFHANRIKQDSLF